MQDRPHVDNHSLKILRFLYENDECSIRAILEKFKISSIDESPEIISTILFFLENGYIGLHCPDGKFILGSAVMPYYLRCMDENSAFFTLEHRLYCLPEGKYIVEETGRQKRYLTIPICISLISAAISACALLYQIFDKSPILVKIVEWLAK